jgi:di/tricarboxylate transporter
VFLSELTSNTAQVATMVPVLAAMAPVLGMNPYVLIVACQRPPDQYRGRCRPSY